MIPEIIFNVVFIVLVALIYNNIIKGRRYESDFDKRVLNFFLLGLFFIVLKAVASVGVMLGVTSLLMSSTALVVYDYLLVLCFLLGAFFLKDLILTSE